MAVLRWIFVLVALALAVIARADVPSPGQSTVDPCLVLCPAGDLGFHVTVRGTIGNPYPFAYVVLAIGACPGFALCALTGNEPYSYQSDAEYQYVGMFADAQGQVTLPVRAGGGCPPGTVRVYADGVLLETRAVASPDQNGDSVVQAQDVSLLQSKLGSADPTGDLDCNGTVDGADLALLQSHAGHACAAPTGTAPGTWGRIKTLYR